MAHFDLMFNKNIIYLIFKSIVQTFMMYYWSHMFDPKLPKKIDKINTPRRKCYQGNVSFMKTVYRRCWHMQTCLLRIIFTGSCFIKAVGRTLTLFLEDMPRKGHSMNWRYALDKIKEIFMIIVSINHRKSLYVICLWFWVKWEENSHNNDYGGDMV